MSIGAFGARARIPWSRGLAPRRTSPVAAIAAVDLLVVAVFAEISPDHVFFELDTVSNVAVSGAVVLLLGIGIALLLGAGEFDISLGANLVLASVVGAKVMTAIAGPGADRALTWAITAGVLAAVATGTAIGTPNGLIVTRLSPR